MLQITPKTLASHVKEMAAMTVMNAKDNNVAKNNAKNTENPHYYMELSTRTIYTRGKLLGKGGFANCYELTDLNTKRVYAGKIVPKTRISKPHQREKITREIDLHRKLKHKNIVEFHKYFEDDDNVIILLEYCSRKSLVHVLKQRKTVTEPEVRYYLRHLIEGCMYIHSHNIIHRDLKLGNMLLNDAMEIKIADFGLATQMNHVGDKKMTVCGTPNYIAPEVLQKRGHSYEADIWAIGCTMFAMLVGRPPFETPTLKETYLRIATNKFFIPNHISPSAKSLMRKLLSPNPDMRPKLRDILNHDFFKTGINPLVLPATCCNSAPTWPQSPTRNGLVKKETTFGPDTVVTTENVLKRSVADAAKDHLKLPENNNVSNNLPNDISTPAKSPTKMLKQATATLSPINDVSEQENVSPNRNLPSNPIQQKEHHEKDEPQYEQPAKIGVASTLCQILSSCLEDMPDEVDVNPSPTGSEKVLWIIKWVDYSNKYGFGYQLSNRTVGVLFNEGDRIVLGSDGRSVQFVDVANRAAAFSTEFPPPNMIKRSKLVTYFATYMDENLIQGGEVPEEVQEVPGITLSNTFMKKWFRTEKAIVMYLSNGILQVNFFDDHTKIIVNMDKGKEHIATLIDEERKATSYHLEDIRTQGCSIFLRDRLEYARNMLQNIIDSEGDDV
ncbi:serine/threonine-protein kinase PLK1-like isoform X2 [Tubulanus polymorphus]|uniref:serine/threonine-protein kinase PLK1-like isoform X2 n=1 Tax=Tubulanus polymorphus TaxID=672921 RepID=UPI003DA62D84